MDSSQLQMEARNDVLLAEVFARQRLLHEASDNLLLLIEDYAELIRDGKSSDEEAFRAIKRRVDRIRALQKAVAGT